MRVASLLLALVVVASCATFSRTLPADASPKEFAEAAGMTRECADRARLVAAGTGVGSVVALVLVPVGFVAGIFGAMGGNSTLVYAGYGTGIIAAPSSLALGSWSFATLYESTQHDERAADLYTGQSLAWCEP